MNQQGDRLGGMPKIDESRQWESHMRMAQIGATAGGGVCRLSLSDEDKVSRDLFVKWAEDAGCSVRVDQVGNIFARRPGVDNRLPPVMTGSHLDTQPLGGRFDGAYGVLAGLEVVRTLNDANIETRHPLSEAGPQHIKKAARDKSAGPIPFHEGSRHFTA